MACGMLTRVRQPLNCHFCQCYFGSPKSIRAFRSSKPLTPPRSISRNFHAFIVARATAPAVTKCRRTDLACWACVALTVFSKPKKNPELKTFRQAL